MTKDSVSSDLIGLHWEAMMLIYRPPACLILGNIPDQKQKYHL